MKPEIHALVQDAYDVNLVCDNPKEQNMGARRKSPVATTNFIAWPTSARIAGHNLDGPTNLRDIVVSLIDAPSIR